MRLYQRLKRQFLSNIYLVRGAILLGVMALLVGIWLVVRPLGSTVGKVWEAANAQLPVHNGRTNILILGREGESSRAGADLTDTLILASVHSLGDTALVSIPRDLWVASLRAKINTAYYYGEQRQPGSGGIILAKAAVEELTGQPVHFAVVIDFQGFEEVIDLLGGVDITVDTGFVDEDFPLPGRENDTCGGDPLYRCRYETVQFDQGWQHMDGQTALKFVRSRHATGDEGTDFARSRRQEKLLLALKDKLLSSQVLLNPALLVDLYTEVNQIVVSDIPPSWYPTFAKLALKAIDKPTRSIALTEPDWVYHPPVSPTYDMQWVLLPTDTLSANVEDFLSVGVQN